MHKDLKEILFTNSEIVSKCKELAKQINTDYKDKHPIIVTILKGSVPFSHTLTEHIKLDVIFDYIKVSSYMGTSSKGSVNITLKPSQNLENQDLIIIEDIIDSGLTLNETIKLLNEYKPASIKTVALLDKPSRRKVDFKPDYVGFTIPDKFVVGFGLDFNEKYRELPYIGVLKEEMYK